MSYALRHFFPNCKQILGGGLSAAWKTVLENTSIDVVVRGEGDETIIDLLKQFEKEGDISGVKGIACRAGDGVIDTGRRRLISPLDKLPYPDFGAVDFDRYLVDGLQFLRGHSSKVMDQRFYDKKRAGKRMITIPVSRGCFGRCTFCYRAYPGLRSHSYKYIFDFVEYCVDRFDVGFFTFGDECFAPSKKWNQEFLNELEKRKLDIVFRILGMRVDTVDEDILRAYKEAGCWMIEYGFESGSQKILNIIDKRVSVDQNRQVAIWTNDAGIHTSPALVLGMPGETSDTIGESIAFLNSLGFSFRQYQLAYAMAIPGSTLYEYAKLTGRIGDEDNYLEMISGKTNDRPHCNLTQEPEAVVISWANRIRREVDAYYFSRKLGNRLLGSLAEIFWGKFYSLRNLYRGGTLGQGLRHKFSTFVVLWTRKTRKGSTTTSRKRDAIFPGIDEFLSGKDHTRPNKNASLREYNKRLKTLSPHIS